MPYDSETRSAMTAGRILIACLVLFAFSWFKSCQELRLRLTGDTAQGQYQGVESHSGRRGNVTYTAEYTFEVEGTSYRGGYGINLADAERELAPGTLEVTYLPSEPKTNRPSGHGNWLWISLFLFFLLACIGFGVQTYRQAKADIARSR
ncbi:MAG: hypothetical protein PF961_02970 [Planctomycetota bacterium]|nr:hypothetical protein [Planctomycetota bacterium]